MGPKITREMFTGATKKRSKKQRKKQEAAALAELGKGLNKQPQNIYEAVQNDVILVDSSENEEQSDGIVVESDTETQNGVLAPAPVRKEGSVSKPARKKQKLADSGNEVAKNNDFIGFGFSSSEDEGEDDDENDENDENGEFLGPTNAQGDHSLAFPWIKGQNHLKQKEIADWLTLEIKDFVNYISPSKDEIVVRNTVISTLKEHISSFWPETLAHVFGSCATDLYLPGSDIDMVVISTTGDYEQRSRLYQLSSYLRTHKLAKNIEVIALAKVPIIKFVDPKYNIHVDVSFERTNGIDAARRIRRWLDTNPGLRELVLIVKQFLRSRMLNNVHVGGLGGYATIIMVYHFLKLHPRVATGTLAPMENLGTLLIEFFELYGRNFSYDNLILALDPKDDSPKYLRKYRHPALVTGRGQFTIVIQDPSDPDNNITRSSYNLRDLKKAFAGAYQLLTAKCFELNSASYKNRIGQLILGDIITYRGKDRDFNDDRDKVVNSALISHDASNDEDESDGADGNDKYYFSDMTAESDGETYVANPPAKRAKLSSSADKQATEPTPLSVVDGKIVIPETPLTELATLEKLTKLAKLSKNVEDFLSLDVDSEEDDDDEEKKARQKPKANLDKDVKREFWKLKALGVE